MLVASPFFILFFNPKFSTISDVMLTRLSAYLRLSRLLMIMAVAMYMAHGFYGGEIRKVRFQELSL